MEAKDSSTIYLSRTERFSSLFCSNVSKNRKPATWKDAEIVSLEQMNVTVYKLHLSKAVLCVLF